MKKQKHENDGRKVSDPRNGAGVRCLDDGHRAGGSDRRGFLRALAAQGVSVPAAYFLIGGNPAGSGIPEARAEIATEGGRHKGALRLPAGAGETGPGHNPIVRDFTDPYIELIRLLREASEIEHALMIQYLYAAFSIKPAYASLAGYGDPNSTDLLGVAIEEMQHLGQVNRLLVALGGAPNLARQDFPYEPDIYPFAFQLEPLGRESLAKYVWTEASADALDRSAARTPADRDFLDRLDNVLGANIKPNHVGSLYARVIATLKEVIASPPGGLPDLEPWIDRLEGIKDQGERLHFEFFRQVFMGTHPGFNGHPDIWRLRPRDAAYPAFQLPVNPSAYVGHENQIGEPAALSTAWLGNLHYWTVLFLLDFAYREESSVYIDLARSHMMGPVWSIARHLPTLRAGMPFDPLSMGYAPGRNRTHGLRLIMHIVREAEELEKKIAALLPGDFPSSTGQETLKAVQAELNNPPLKPDRWL